MYVLPFPLAYRYIHCWIVWYVEKWLSLRSRNREENRKSRPILYIPCYCKYLTTTCCIWGIPQQSLMGKEKCQQRRPSGTSNRQSAWVTALLGFPWNRTIHLVFFFFFSFPLVETVMDEGNEIKSESKWMNDSLRNIMILFSWESSLPYYSGILVVVRICPPGLCRKSFAGGTGRGRRNPRSFLKVQG